MSDNHQRVESAIKAFAKGEIVVVTDDDDRENEGDLFVAASHCTPDKMAFIIRNTSGIVCAPLGAEQARRLHLDPMVADNEAPLGTAFTVSVDVRHGLTTGISAEERCNTVRALANDNSGAADFVRPGHVFPLVARQGGVLMRSGHTEACVDLCRLASLPPVGVLAELMNDNGSVMRGPEVAAFAKKHKLAQLSIADLIAYRQNRDKLVERVGEFQLASEIGTLQGYAYVTPFDRVHHMAFVYGDIAGGKDIPARLHRADVIGDVFGGAKSIRASLARLQKGRPRRDRVPARRHRRRSGRRYSARRHRHRCGALAAVARDRLGRANPQGSRHFLDPPAGVDQAHLCRSGRFRHRNRDDGNAGKLSDRPFFRPMPHASIPAWGDGFVISQPLLAVAAAGLALAASAAPTPPKFADTRASAIPVDVELVIAVDVSYSMDPDEQALQREGYVLALTSKEFLQALRQGAHGKIAITYFEWAGQSDQKILMPWRLIDGPESADAVAAEIARAPYRRASRTSISGGLRFAKPLFDDSGYKGLRRVIDVSGDGANNAGPLVELTRDDVLAAGITINGLPIMLKRPYTGTMDIDNLDEYYEDCVIGGPGAFVIPIREREKFIEATRTKLILEVAGRQPEPQVVPAASRARVSCTIGERLWQERWGGYQ